MANKKHILDLSKERQKPSLSFGVNVTRVDNPAKKRNYEIKPRIPVKKKIESIKDFSESRVNFTKDIYNIWNKGNNSDKFEKYPTKNKKAIFSWVIFLAIFAAIFTYIVYWNNTREIKGEGVILQISGDDKVVSGNQVKLTIKYQNKQNIKIKNLELRINYPKDFYYISAIPEATTLSFNVWKLDDLKPNQSGQIELVGQVVGDPDTKTSLDATLSYEPTNFNSNLEVKASKDIEIAKSLMDFSFDGPSEVNANDRVVYTIKYKNISDADLNNFRVRLESPSNFVLIDASGDAKLDSENTWLIDNLKKDEEKTITLTGIFDLEENSTTTMKAILEVKSLISDNPLINQDALGWYSYKELSKDIKLIQPPVNLKLSVNDKLIDNAINWGDQMNYVINYKNISDAPIENVSVKVKIDSDYIDFKNLQDDYGGVYDKNDNTITWDKSSIPSLAKINSNQDGRIKFNLKLQNFKDDFISKNNYSVTSSVEFYYGKNSENKLSSNLIVNKITTPVDFSIFSRYYDESGKAVGSGPIPPIVGEATTYQVLWKFKPKTNNLSSIAIKSTLGDNVDWGEGTVLDGQDLSFNEATKQIVWQIDNAEKNKEYSVKFNLIITPENKNIGRPMILVNAAVFSAQDDYSKAIINLSKNPLTTECLGDKKASGKGNVIDLK